MVEWERGRGSKKGDQSTGKRYKWWVSGARSTLGLGWPVLRIWYTFRTAGDWLEPKADHYLYIGLHDQGRFSLVEAPFISWFWPCRRLNLELPLPIGSMVLERGNVVIALVSEAPSYRANYSPSMSVSHVVFSSHVPWSVCIDRPQNLVPAAEQHTLISLVYPLLAKLYEEGQIPMPTS